MGGGTGRSVLVFPTFWDESGIGAYSVFWHTNVLLAAHLTVFHTAISVTASVLVVEWLAPRARHRPWTGRGGLSVASVVLAATPIVYGEFDQRPPTPVLVAAGGLLVLVVAAAFAVGRRPSAARPERTPRRLLGSLAFSCILAHWALTYSVAETEIRWPAGVVVSLAPVVLAIALVSHLAATGPYGTDGIRVVVGLLTFFVLLDLVIGFLGRYDMIFSACITAYFVRRLYTRRGSVGAQPVQAA